MHEESKQKLLLATTNPAKAKEYAELLADLNVEIITLADLKDVQPVEEDGATFVENAMKKARGYFSQFGLPLIADDGGLLIDALGGEPGVKSNRWLGRPATDEELVRYALEKLKNCPREKRTARLATTAVYYDGKNSASATAEIAGDIVTEMPEIKEKGFPWRAILFLPEFGKLYQDLNESEHEKINHRRKIVKELKAKIRS
ncbi:MAG: non-canonical purine NTP pyrophosphatase [Patescibacteria group bacterium]